MRCLLLVVFDILVSLSQLYQLNLVTNFPDTALIFNLLLRNSSDILLGSSFRWGNYTQNHNKACFVSYLKIINTFFETW